MEPLLIHLHDTADELVGQVGVAGSNTGVTLTAYADGREVVMRLGESAVQDLRAWLAAAWLCGFDSEADVDWKVGVIGGEDDD